MDNALWTLGAIPLILVILCLAVQWVMSLCRSDMVHKIPGPSSLSWVFGNMRELLLTSTYGEYEFRWLRQYGAVYRIQGCFGETRLMVSDPAAMHWIVTSGHFTLGPSTANTFRLLFQTGSLVLTDNHEHKRLRTAFNPGFSAAAVRKYLPIFERAAQILTEQLEHHSGEAINISPFLGQATISPASEVILGHPVEDFGVEFITNNLAIVALAVNQSASQIPVDALFAWIPAVIRDATIHLPFSPFTVLNNSKFLANRIGKKLVEEKMTAAQRGIDSTGGFYGELVNSHMLSERDIVAQTSLVLTAGQETTAATTAFGLVELAQNIEFQKQLRAEIHSAAGGRRTDEVGYDSMPLLNAFIKETLRMYPAEPLPERMATQDTVIPLTESITMLDGKQISSIPIRKGQVVMFAVASYQRLYSRWGQDPDKFNPARWLDNGGVYKGEAIGPYANLLSFYGGPRTCLGWRFAILELQVFICELVGKFEFTLPSLGITRARYGGTLFPTLPDGKKGAVLSVKRVI
ncbi:cytochrome P450 [Favolaschia claudopus]|uniref:Cytochrome P450 n=1 Tax=Favolaschia claudopus TaxID=2862362 RepID=A0AAV9ZQ67_9AGAR